MDLEQQKEVIELYNQYQDTDRDTIKANIKNYMDNNNIKPAEAAEKSGMPVQTIYHYRKFNNKYKPDFITTMILCNALKIPITNMMQGHHNLDIPKPKKSKWSMTAKQDFIKDYSKLSITELCEKYNLTPRTAQEYNRHFSNDLESV